MKIALKHKDYEIEVEEMDVGEMKFFNSYVTSPKFTSYSSLTDYENIGDCTFHAGQTIGFDTAHGHNMKMSQAELFVDAIKQAIVWLEKFDEGKITAEPTYGSETESING